VPLGANWSKACGKMATASPYEPAGMGLVEVPAVAVSGNSIVYSYTEVLIA